jgi:hypothetical protein
MRERTLIEKNNYQYDMDNRVRLVINNHGDWYDRFWIVRP